jgi:hypothetical protein
VVIHVFSLSLSQLMVLRKFLSPDQFSRSKVEGATLFFFFTQTSELFSSSSFKAIKIRRKKNGLL